MAGKNFNAFLKRVFDATGIHSQNELANVLKVNRSAITQARKKNAIPQKWLVSLYRIFGLNPDWVELGIGRTFLRQNENSESIFADVPKVRARLSTDASFETQPEIESFYAFRREWLENKGKAESMVLMEIFGNSMSPEIKEGDLVLIDESQKDIISGAVYAVGIDDTIMVKRLEKHPGKLVLISANKDYSPIFIDNPEICRIKIMGRVVWACREFR